MVFSKSVQAISNFFHGVRLAYSDDRRIGPNDNQALKDLAAVTHVPGLKWLVDLFTRDAAATPRVSRLSKGTGYAAHVVTFKPGPGGGFNRDHLEVVTGRPEGTGDSAGSLDVVSLGKGGEIVLELGRSVKTGIKVFENPFGADGKAVNPQPVKVEVFLEKTHRWVELKGEAGKTPVYTNSKNRIPVRNKAAGGDVFLFKDSKLPKGASIRRVRLTDTGQAGNGPVGTGTAGADIDAVYGF